MGAGIDVELIEHLLGSTVDGVALFLIGNAAGGNLYGKPGLGGSLLDEVLAHGGAADISGAYSHDSIHAHYVPMKLSGKGGRAEKLNKKW